MSIFDGKDVEVAKPFLTFDDGACFKGGGNSHFTYDLNGFHATTEVGGMKQKEPIKIHFPINFEE